MQGAGWRHCLFAFLLAASVADVSSDLNDGDQVPGVPADSRSGYLTDADIDNDNEPRAEDGESELFAESLANFGINGYPENDERRRKNIFEPVDWIDENDSIYKMETPDGALFPGLSLHPSVNELPVPQEDVNEIGPTQFDGQSDDNQSLVDELKNDPIYVMDNAEDPMYRIPDPSAYPPEYTFPGGDKNAAEPTHHDHSQDQDGSRRRDQFVESAAPEGLVLQDDLVFSKGPTQETVVLNNEYPYSSENSSSSRFGSSLFKRHKFFSKLVPLGEHILLHKIPGAENIIKCTSEGEIHNFWAPGFQCMVCVCLAASGRLRPVCVSCQSCMTPPAPTTHRPTLPPYTPPPTPPPPPEHVSCKPLPVNVPFPSPIDPCKVCVCTETLNQWGKMDVIIQCQHNPQCVLPTTPRTPVSTPVPLPVCDKLPPNVPFPHPHDACKICQCIVNRTPYGQTERQVVCYTSPECQPTTSTQSPGPDIMDLPPPEICDRYPENVMFPHPRDQCQVCKCSVNSGLFLDRKKITCYVRPSCSPTPKPWSTTTPVPWTPSPVPDNEDLCERYPHDVYFADPLDPCRACKCHKDLFQRKAQITCVLRPECASTPEPPPKPDHASCAPLPTGRPFQNPLQPCQICICTEIMDAYGETEVAIECQENPQCVLPPDFTTISPEITNHTVEACKNFPKNVYFPHPSDSCKLCKCNVALRGPYSPPEQHMSCIIKPECSLTPRPPPTTTPEPEPEIVSCAPLPVGKPFQSPVNPCHICMCTEQADLFGRHDVQIECKDNPQCIVPPYEPTIPPIIVKPIRWQACKNFPRHVSFPHPRDPCQRCKCSVQKDRYGTPVDYIGCSSIPECVLPSTTEYPITNEVCGRYPINSPFDDPNDQCRTCTCTQIGSAAPGALQHSLFPPKYQILCQIKPECLPPPTTEHPAPYEVCGRYPINSPFDDPNDQCRTCTCTYKLPGSAAPSALQHSLYPPQLQILCQIKPECLPTEKPEPNSICDYHQIDLPFDDPLEPCRSCVCYWGSGAAPGPSLMHVLQTKLYKCVLKPECLPTPQPVTEEPEPYSFCQNYPVEVPFTDPRDPCRSCVCYNSAGAPPGSAPAELLGSASPVILFRCTLKPECYRPTSEPITISIPTDVSCKPMPKEIPFQSPLNPCQICTCTEIVDVYGRLDVVFKCQTNPQCVIPLDVTTVPPDSHTSPVPLPACAQFPTNVVFPHPRDPCKLCKCTVQRTPWGQPEQLINCFTNPDCGLEPTTIEPPVPSICDFQPPNVPFVLPTDPCQSCRCIVERTIYGEIKKLICAVNPACSDTRTTPAPWPPAPPGPLPGPAPHESCAPYIPSQPFQHPWDDCQVCACTEAISLERITIEVNCYTKPSCCYEPPFEIPGLPGPGILGSGSPDGGGIGVDSRPLVDGGSTSWTNPGSGYNNQAFNWKHTNENGIGTAGGNLIGPIGGNTIYSSSGNLIGPSGGTLYRPGGSYQAYDPNVIDPSSGSNYNIRGDNLVVNQGETHIAYSNDYLIGQPGNLIGPVGGNSIGPSGGNIVDYANENWIKLAGSNVIEPTSGNMIGSAGGNVIGSMGYNVIGPTSGNLNGPAGGNWIGTNSGDLFGTNSGDLFGTNSENLYGYSDGNLVGSNPQPFLNPNGNLYIPKRGNTLIRPTEGEFGHGLWKKTYNYNLRPEEAVVASSDDLNNNAAAFRVVQQQYSNKMRTKSGRPSDDESADYDEST